MTKKVAKIHEIKGDDEVMLMKHVTPAKTDTYTPVPHKQVIDIIRREVKARGLQIQSVDYRTGFAGDRVIGLYKLINPDEIQIEGEDRLVRTIAFRNSTDKSMSFGVGGGASVFICSNGMFSADMSYVKKHVGNIDEVVEEKIMWVFDGLEAEFRRLNDFRKHLKEQQISKRVAAELVGRLIMEENLLTATQVSIVREQRENSEYFADDTAWALYNNVTEALKQTKPTKYYANHQQLSEFFLKEFAMAE